VGVHHQLRQFGWAEEGDQCDTDNRVVQGLTQRELPPTVAVFGSESLQLIPGARLRRKSSSPKDSEQIQIAAHTSPSSANLFLELHSGGERPNKALSASSIRCKALRFDASS
jgi:hypothetical protein